MKVDYFICPECGAEVRVGSKGCGKCASERATKTWGDERRGWEQDSVYDGLDLPDDEFDYQKFVDEEFGGGTKRPPIGWFWWVVAVVVLAALVGVWVAVWR
jgi:hypothetical protein